MTCRYHDFCRGPARTGLGHVAGGGAGDTTITNSPVNITININIGSNADARLNDDTGRPTELGRVVLVLGRLFRRGDGGGAVNIGGDRFIEEVARRD